MEYGAPVLITSDTFKKAMNGIQYKALRTIYKQPPRCSSKILHVKANIPKSTDQLSLYYYNKFKNSNSKR